MGHIFEGDQEEAGGVEAKKAWGVLAPALKCSWEYGRQGSAYGRAYGRHSVTRTGRRTIPLVTEAHVFFQT